MRRAARRDTSEPGIIAAFREGGATVYQLSAKGIPDLLVGFLGVTHLVECKTGNAGWTEEQKRFQDKWEGEQVVNCRTPAQARRWIAVWAQRKPTLATVLSHEAPAGVYGSIPAVALLTRLGGLRPPSKAILDEAAAQAEDRPAAIRPQE